MFLRIYRFRFDRVDWYVYRLHDGGLKTRIKKNRIFGIVTKPNAWTRDMISCRRRDKESKEDDPVGHRLDVVLRHVGVLQRGVGVDSDVAVLRPSTVRTAT